MSMIRGKLHSDKVLLPKTIVIDERPTARVSPPTPTRVSNPTVGTASSISLSDYLQLRDQKKSGSGVR